MSRAIVSVVAGLVLMAGCAGAAEIKVKDTAGLKAAIKDLKPGTTVLIAPGKYEGVVFIVGASGTEKERIVIRGENPADPPVFQGPKESFHFVSCNYVTLANVEVRGAAVNGVNADDGGKHDKPSVHMIFENVRILETGPKGNNDPIKLSGLEHFLVKDCRLEGWGGQGVDMVGCHRGAVEGCYFENREGIQDMGEGIQMKGGCSEILVHRNFFKSCGDRAIAFGGWSDLTAFRPRVEGFEAKDITIAGNRFAGNGAPVAWDNASGGRFHHNTVYLPERWVLRILQSKKDDPQFQPCHDGIYENNLVVFDKHLADGEFVNVGKGTDAKSFVFRNNAWFEAGGNRKPTLPTPEAGGIYGVDPELKDAGTPQMKIGSADQRLRDVGADAYKPEPAPEARREGQP